MADVLLARLQRLACDFDLKDNYFAWQAFGRRYATNERAPLPPYLQREAFARLRKRAGDMKVVHASFTEHLAAEPAASLDAYVLLDAQDWMTDEQLGCAVDRDRAHRQAWRPRHLPHGRRGDDPARARAGRDLAALHLRSPELPRADGQGPLVDLRRLPSLHARQLRNQRVANTGASAAQHMDAIYRYQRYVYDATRKFYLLGRDRVIDELAPPPAGRVLEIACGTGRNLIAAARRYPDARFYGFDISAAMLDTARGKINRAGLDDRIRLAAADATDFSPERVFGAAAFDRIFISYALSMIPPWRARAAARAGRTGAGRQNADRRLRNAGASAALVQAGVA